MCYYVFMNTFRRYFKCSARCCGYSTSTGATHSSRWPRCWSLRPPPSSSAREPNRCSVEHSSFLHRLKYCIYSVRRNGPEAFPHLRVPWQQMGIGDHQGPAARGLHLSGLQEARRPYKSRGNHQACEHCERCHGLQVDISIAACNAIRNSLAHSSF